MITALISSGVNKVVFAISIGVKVKNLMQFREERTFLAIFESFSFRFLIKLSSALTKSSSE